MAKSTQGLFIIAALGAGAYFLMSPKKASASTETKKIPPSGPPKNGGGGIKIPEEKPEPKPLPNPDDEIESGDYENLPIPPPDESPELPDLDEEQPSDEDLEGLPKTEDAQGQAQLIPNMADYYQKWLKTGNEVPGSPDPHKLWISDSCQSWGVGKNWAPYLLAKYLLDETLLNKYKIDPNEMMLPTDYWDTIGGTYTPDPIYTYDLAGDIPRYQIARNILALYAPQCWDEIPKRKNYDTFKAYHEALISFTQTNFGQLFKFLSDAIAEEMYENWRKQYPIQADIEDRKGWALWAVRKYPKYSVNEQTNQAYKNYFINDPKAPKKIDPKIPSHKPYQTAWIDLNQYVKKYRDLIKNYG